MSHNIYAARKRRSSIVHACFMLLSSVELYLARSSSSERFIPTIFLEFSDILNDI